MSKVYGINGFLRGKLGNTVFAIRNGEQLARQYNPNPLNPKSASQTANRAKLKLLSQLGAALQPVIAIPRVGMVSPRNGFTQANYPVTEFTDDEATINLNNIRLTKSSVALGGFMVDRGGGNNIQAYFLEDITAVVDAVVYVVLYRTGDLKVSIASSRLVSTPGPQGEFETNMPYHGGDIAVLAYGIRYNTVAARTAFGSINVPDALGVAKLFSSRTLVEGDATMSETRGIFLADGEDSRSTE